MIKNTANLLGVVSLEIATQIQHRARELMNHAGETPAALVVIGYDLGPTNDQLKNILGLSHSGTVRLIDRLVAEGLVERKAGRDNREIALFATRRGKALREKVLAERLATIEPLLAPLTQKEHTQLHALLHKLLTAMEPTEPERRHLCRLCDDRVCENCPIPADKTPVPW